MSLFVPEVGASTVEEMRRLVADLASQHKREQFAYEDGFKTGFFEGWDVGYGHACHEMAQQWAQVAEHVRQHSRARTWAEIQQLRKEAA